MQGEKTSPVDEAIAGEIVAVAKTEDLHTGTSLGEVELPPIKFPTPMVGLAVAPKARGDETKLSGALHKITEEDRTVRLDHDQETKEMVLTGMSELHLQLLRERLKRRDKVEVETHEPKIPYRETIQANAEGSYRHKKQSGGSGQFGEVHIRMYPFPEGTKPEDFATKERFPQLKNTHLPREEQFPVGRYGGGRLDTGQLHAGDRKRLFGKDHLRRRRRLSGSKHLRRSSFRQRSSGGFQRNGVPDRGPQGVCERVPRSETEPAGADRENARSPCRSAMWATYRATFPGGAARWSGMDSAGGGMTTVEATAPLLK